MARPVHWTHDPISSHLRNPPTWYHYQRMPLYTPSPAARMEKRLAEERRAKWQWYDSQAGSSSAVSRACAETIWCPCGVYGRTWARLKAALAGHDAENIPDPGVFNSDCCEYAMCFPFYGCLVSRLQATVRSFYGIDGDDTSDWRDGWCCPCVTLERNEYEIIMRERQHRRLKELHTPTPDTSQNQSQYQPPTPMTYEASHSQRPSMEFPIPVRPDAGHLRQHTLETEPMIARDIALMQRERAMRAPIISITTPSQLSRDSEGGAHCLADHQVVSGHIIQPEHGLGDDRTVSVRGKFKEHLITSDAPSPPRQASPVPHTLDDDPRLAKRKDRSTDGLNRQLDGADSQVWDDVTEELLHRQPEDTTIQPALSTVDTVPEAALQQGENIGEEPRNKEILPDQSKDALDARDY